eukprot:CAMPEP_0194373228 /NCGR_PEP_ID=MMETSP0174-20130528/21649_1 /TAXON_ID=216777 /ORGANISM="Proboscia alata, Strain PI-D3" /LENGTH=705 /DNA_ID=CAMNT_0039152183 /DNA_START=72 /DNA_END=2189 /DNA_ORIENTATION=-
MNSQIDEQETGTNVSPNLDPFPHIESGNDYVDLQDYWSAADSYSQAHSILIHLSREKEDDNNEEDRTRISRLYQEQAGLYLQKGRECLVDAMRGETNSDNSGDRDEDGAEEGFLVMMRLFEQLKEDEKMKREAIFHQLFVERLPQTFTMDEMMSEGEEEEYLAEDSLCEEDWTLRLENEYVDDDLPPPSYQDTTVGAPSSSGTMSLDERLASLISKPTTTTNVVSPEPEDDTPPSSLPPLTFSSNPLPKEEEEEESAAKRSEFANNQQRSAREEDLMNRWNQLSQEEIVAPSLTDDETTNNNTCTEDRLKNLGVYIPPKQPKLTKINKTVSPADEVDALLSQVTEEVQFDNIDKERSVGLSLDRLKKLNVHVPPERRRSTSDSSRTSLCEEDEVHRIVAAVQDEVKIYGVTDDSNGNTDDNGNNAGAVRNRIIDENEPSDEEESSSIDDNDNSDEASSLLKQNMKSTESSKYSKEATTILNEANTLLQENHENFKLNTKEIGSDTTNIPMSVSQEDVDRLIQNVQREMMLTDNSNSRKTEGETLLASVDVLSSIVQAQSLLSKAYNLVLLQTNGSDIHDNKSINNTPSDTRNDSSSKMKVGDNDDKEEYICSNDEHDTDILKSNITPEQENAKQKPPPLEEPGLETVSNNDNLIASASNNNPKKESNLSTLETNEQQQPSPSPNTNVKSTLLQVKQSIESALLML